MNANYSLTPTSRTAGSSNSNATSGGRCGVLPQHRETPLATCEARARLAFKRGEIDEATYHILLGISAEALLTMHDEARGAAGPWVQPRKQITPCGTPPMIQREVIPVNGGEVSPYSPKLQLPGGDISVNEGAALSALMALSPRTQAQEHSSPQEYAPEVKLSAASAPPSISISIAISEGQESELDKISKQGFSLAERAQRFSEGTPGSAGEETERLLKFADACVKAYPPSSASSKKAQEESDSSYDIIWQNRLGFEVPRDEGASSSPSNDKKSDAAQWEIRYEELLKFKTTHGHCKVSYRNTKSNCLSSWAFAQRDQYKDGTLLKTRYERLQQIGFSWEAKQANLPKINDKNIRNYDDLWDHRFNQLKNYKVVTGHCNVPYRWKNDRQLGRWVQNQREFYKRKILSMDRYRRLAELGFCWYVRRAKADKSVEAATPVYMQCNTVTQHWALKKDETNAPVFSMK